MIDWAQVRQLQEDVGADEMDEVDEAMKNLECDYTLMAPKDRSAAFHFLKGCASNLGFKTFAERFSQGEELTKAGDEPDFNITDLVQLYAVSKETFMTEKTTQLG